MPAKFFETKDDTKEIEEQKKKDEGHFFSNLLFKAGGGLSALGVAGFAISLFATSGPVAIVLGVVSAVLLLGGIGLLTGGMFARGIEGTDAGKEIAKGFSEATEAGSSSMMGCCS